MAFCLKTTQPILLFESVESLRLRLCQHLGSDGVWSNFKQTWTCVLLFESLFDAEKGYTLVN